MPKSVFELIRREGLGKTIYLLTDKNRRILERRKNKYRLQISKVFKEIIIGHYQERLAKLQRMIESPHSFLSA